MTSLSAISGGGMAHHAQMRQAMFSKMDSDGSGGISKDEFISARPKNVSEADSAALYAKIDTEGGNALTQDQLDAGMKANKPDGMGSMGSNLSSDMLSSLIGLLSNQGTKTQDTQSQNGSSSSDALFGKIDTDQNGKVTKEEFVDARPKGVSEEKAGELFASIDTDNAGSVTQSQFEASMPKGGPSSPPPPMGGMASSDDSELEDTLESILKKYGYTNSANDSTSTSESGTASTTATESNQTTALLQEFMKAAQSYNSSLNREATMQELTKASLFA
ncbi:MAG: EF-hand domain-containing protein [Alphaproteobacteria bacterium]|nr:MAG: EF-hand domain-containing protein [Alphaproteobacteria bacterium]